MKTAQFVWFMSVVLLAGCQCGRHTERTVLAPSPDDRDDVPAPGMVKVNVMNSRVPWKEDLTVANAILTAEYLGARDPVSISVRRQGERFFVSPTRLLQGLVDPWLEPGDILELHTSVLLTPPYELPPARRVALQW